VYRFDSRTARLPLFLKFGIGTLLIVAPIAAVASLRPLYRQISWSRDLNAIPLQAESRVVGRTGNLRVVSQPGRPLRLVGSEAVVSELAYTWIPLADRFTRVCPGRPMSVLLSYTAAGDRDLELIERAPDLYIVELDGTLVTDAGICHLRNLKKQFRLGLAHTAITDLELERLAELSSLIALNLCGTRVTNRGLRFIARLPKLDTLDLSDTQVTGPGLIELLSLTRLEILTLDHLAINDADVAFLCDLPTLKNLSLAGTHITDAGLLKLASLPSLRTISVAHTRVTDAGVLRFETVRGHYPPVRR
jgi:hypothetical protein